MSVPQSANLRQADIVAAAKRHSGAILMTIARSAPFQVRVDVKPRSGEEYPVFIPMKTGVERKATNRRYLEAICKRFNESGSLMPRDYKDCSSQNKSYILRLVQLARDEPL